MRTLVIGDIHGSHRSLKAVLDAAQFDLSSDRIICLGDYVDGWGDSAEVVSYLIEIQQNSEIEHIFILGNHDIWFSELLCNNFERFRDQVYVKQQYAGWIKQGGDSTYQSYLKLSDAELLSHRENFFKLLKPYFLEDNRLYVHAGFDPSIGFEETVKTKPVSLQWSRELYERALNYWHLQATGVSVDEINNFGGFDKIYIGHTPTFHIGILQPVKMINVINLDQGCKINGRLTLWVDNDDTFFQCEEMYQSD